MNEKPAHRDSWGLPTRIMKCKTGTPILRGLPPRLMYKTGTPRYSGTAIEYREIAPRSIIRLTFQALTLGFDARAFSPSATTTRIPTFGCMVVFSFFTFGTYECFPFSFGYRDSSFSVRFNNVLATIAHSSTQLLSALRLHG